MEKAPGRKSDAILNRDVQLLASAAFCDVVNGGVYAEIDPSVCIPFYRNWSTRTFCSYRTFVYIFWAGGVEAWDFNRELRWRPDSAIMVASVYDKRDFVEWSTKNDGPFRARLQAKVDSRLI